VAIQARAGIAVSGNSVSGAFTPNTVILINSVNRTTSVQISSLSIDRNRNNEGNTAQFTINRDEGFTPSVGQTVKIGLGDSENLEFAGQIASLRLVRERSGDSPRFDVFCTDWTRLFNRRLITRDFSGEAITDIATTIVEEYTSGFTTEAIETGLGTIDEFICTNETPMGALVRLANHLGGGTYIGADKIVHLWGSGGQSSYHAPSPPATLTNSLSTLKAFTPEYDFTQVRTRVIVEGAQSQLVVNIPTDADFATFGTGIPLDDIWTKFNQSTDAANYARIGNIVFSYDYVQPLPAQVVLVENAITETDTTAIIGPAGGGSVGVTAPGWMTDGQGSYFYYGAMTIVGAGPNYELSSIPASGYGSIQAGTYHPIGTPLYGTPYLVNVTPLAAISEEIPAGAPLIVRSQKDDTSAQTTIAAIEGGDGIHEYFVSDGDLSYAGCAERAQAELDVFSEALVRAEWVTHDLQAVPGASQAINLTSPSALSTTLTIDAVTITVPVDLTNIATSPTTTCDSNLWPRRVCQGSTVKLETVLDAIKR
jgi:hypothetical protein